MIWSRAALFITGSAPGQREHDRVGERVRRLAVARRGPREHLRAGLDLDVHLEPDDGFVVHSVGTPLVPVVRVPRRRAAIASSSASWKGWPIDLQADRQAARG